MIPLARPRLGFVMEQTLGHVTHYTNMRNALTAESGIDASWLPLAFEPQRKLEQLPVLRTNWSARASLRTRLVLARERASERYDALFFHTQVTTLLSAAVMRRVPSVISLDATPINYDAVGRAYGHHRSGKWVERTKRKINAHTLHEASAIVSWCDWARRSLVQDYGVDHSRISVIAPGVDLALWPQPGPRAAASPVKLLFVGGDFERKGGRLLLQAFDSLDVPCELHIVTSTPVDPAPGIYLYRDIKPNSEVLRRLYATCDIFVLPTLADCFPLVIQEAMAAGLPVIATDVGAIGEAVRHGETGLLIPPSDMNALCSTLKSVIGNADSRRRLGLKGREWAEHYFDSAANARRIARLMISLLPQHGPFTRYDIEADQLRVRT